METYIWIREDLKKSKNYIWGKKHGKDLSDITEEENGNEPLKLKEL